MPAAAVDQISPWPRVQFFDSAGHLLTGGKLFTYAAGTTTKQNTFTDSGGLTANVNPVILDTRGEANVWLTPGQCYKYVLSPSTDTDPPTNAFWTVDGICGAITGAGATFAIAAPLEFIVTGSPANLGSTITLAKAVETSHTVWAGPNGGSPAAPTFRALVAADLPPGTRTVFTGGISYCVKTTGLDSNSGISPNCWLTLQHAWNYLNTSVDLAGQIATVNVGVIGTPSAFDGFVASGNVLGATTFASINFVGDTVTPANVTINGTTTSAVVAENGAQFSIGGVTLTASGAGAGQGRCLYVLPSGSAIVFNAVSFGFCQVAQMSATGGTIAVPQPGPANYNILAPGSAYHVTSGQAGFIQLDNAVVTLTGTPPFSTAFANATAGGQIEASSVTFTGAATGVRYTATLNGVIITSGGGANYFPGSSAGSTATGGQYN